MAPSVLQKEVTIDRTYPAVERVNAERSKPGQVWSGRHRYRSAFIALRPCCFVSPARHTIWPGCAKVLVQVLSGSLLNSNMRTRQLPHIKWGQLTENGFGDIHAIVAACRTAVHHLGRNRLAMVRD